MFTGIVKALCSVVSIEKLEGGLRLQVDLNQWTNGLEIGASVAINGVCLTAVAIEQDLVDFDVIQESLNRSNLGSLQVGDRVNMERSFRYGDEIGGHQVNGHVDTIGTIQSIVTSPNNQEVFIQHDPQWNRYLVPKGWIAIDGVSLTVVSVEPDRFSVSLIPETLARTTLGFKQERSPVNLEFDHTTKIIVTTIERLLPSMVQKYQVG